MLPNSSGDLWSTLMELDQYATSGKTKKASKIDEHPPGEYRVSRFGALLATSLLRLPEDKEYRMTEEYLSP